MRHTSLDLRGAILLILSISFLVANASEVWVVKYLKPVLGD